MKPKEAADLTNDETRRKLLKTYGTPERIHIKSVKDVEEAFHAQMCEAAEEQCGKGDAEAKPAVTWRNFPDHKSEDQGCEGSAEESRDRG